MSKIALVHCPHTIGWCYVEKAQDPIATVSENGTYQGDWLMRLPCPCNDKSTVLAEFDALDLIRKLAPDASVELGMQRSDVL
jgi:hypothetical protein